MACHKILRIGVLTAVLSFVPLLSTADWIRLGSWNIEHLGERDDDSVPVALAEHIHLTGLDAIALQEIYDNDAIDATRTNHQLDETLRILNEETRQDWTYEMFPNRYSGDKSQLVAVAWNKKRLSKVGDTYRLEFEREANEWDRHPHAIKLSAGNGRTDIVIIGVHMKANYRADFSDQREKEAKILLESLGDFRDVLDDEDIVLIGDFNCASNSEAAIQAFEEAGFRDLNARDTATHVVYGPLDRIIVPTPGVSTTASEFSFSRQYILAAADSDTFDRFLSDHMMIMTPIRIQNDDD